VGQVRRAEQGKSAFSLPYQHETGTAEKVKSGQEIKKGAEDFSAFFIELKGNLWQRRTYPQNP
jgi:hypothetical protein